MKRITWMVAGGLLLVALVAITLGPRFFGRLATRKAAELQSWAQDAAIGGFEGHINDVKDILNRSGDQQSLILKTADLKIRQDEQSALAREIEAKAEAEAAAIKALSDAFYADEARNTFDFADHAGVTRTYTRAEVAADLGQKINRLKNTRKRVESAKETLRYLENAYEASRESLYTLQADIDSAELALIELSSKNMLIDEMKRRDPMSEVAARASDLAEANKRIATLQERQAREFAELTLRSDLRGSKEGINPLASKPADLREEIADLLGESVTQ